LYSSTSHIHQNGRALKDIMRHIRLSGAIPYDKDVFIQSQIGEGTKIALRILY